MKPFIKYSFLAIVALLALANTTSAATISRPMHHNGLVGYWAFDLGKGGLTAYDTSGQANNGTLTGMDATTDWVDGQIAGALDFDGTNDYVSLPDLASFDGDFTVSAWANSDLSSGDQIFLGINDTPFLELWAGEFGAGGYEWKAYSGTFGGSVHMVSGITPSDWTHISLVRESGLNTLYINGVSKATYSNSETFTANTPNIGVRSDGTTSEWNGKIDEVRIYNRALSAAEVTRLFNLGKQKFTAPDNTGLVGYWKFEEGTGTNAGDSSGNGNDGTLTGSMTESDWVPGKHGTALDFDGSNDHVDVGTISTDFSNGITIGGWVYYDAFNNWSRIIDFGQGQANDNIIFYNPTTTSDLGYAVYTGSVSGTAVVATGALEIGRWMHLIATEDSSGNVVLYKDGVEIQTGSTDVPPVVSRTSSFIARSNWGSDAYFDGRMDDIRVYDRALSATEVEKLFKAGQTKFNSSRNNRLTDGLVGLWSFDGKDMSNNTAFDRSGQGNDGTLTSGPIRAIGKIGQALDFDGINDRVIMGNVLVFTASDPVTISAWFNIRTFAARNPLVSRTTLANRADYNMLITNSTTISYERDTAGDAGVYTDWTVPTFNTGEWHHMAIKLFTDGTVTAYFDGVELSNQTGAHDDYVSTNFYIGVGDDSWDFDGLIDEVRVYDRILSADEISQLYNMSR